MNGVRKSLSVAIPLAFAVGVLTVALGCQPTQPTMAATRAVVSTPADQAVTCDKCKTVWVMQSRRNFKGMITYTRKPKMVCEDCASAAGNFFRTGKLEHTCRTCGGNLEACEGHRQ